MLTRKKKVDYISTKCLVSSLSTLGLFSEGVQWRSNQRLNGPQVRGQETVSVTDGNEGSLQGVLGSSGRTGRRSVNILNTSQLHQLLDNWRSDNTLTSWGWDQSDGNGTTLTSDLTWQRVRSTQVGTPVTSSDWDDRQLGDDDGSLDSGSNFLGGLDTQTNVTVGVTNDDNSLHSGSLTGSGLLLDRSDLHNLVLQLWEQLVNDLVFLDWQRVQVDLLNGGDLTGLDQSTELGDWSPSLLLISSSSSSWTSSSLTEGSLWGFWGSSRHDYRNVTWKAGVVVFDR